MRATTVVFIGTLIACAAVCFAAEIVSEASFGEDTDSELPSKAYPFGENLFWAFNSRKHTLFISGSGSMPDYDSPFEAPWYRGPRMDFDTVIIRRGVTSIGNYAFSNDTDLTSVEIADTVTVIGKFAFMACDHLELIDIPKSVTSIGVYAFYGCGLREVTIPRLVETITEYSFARCLSLTSVNIRKGVNLIEDHAFSECSRLISVSIPSSVRGIKILAFERCSRLSSVTYRGLNDPERSIPIFKDCSLSNLCLPLRYEDESFCGKLIARAEIPPQYIQEQENSCYEILVCGGLFLVEKREDAVEWEERAEGCFIHTCNNKTGLTANDACELNNPLSACYQSKCQNDGTCSNISLYNGTVGGCVESIECDPKEGWKETKKNCRNIILEEEKGVSLLTAGCYEYTCSGNGTCEYSPKKSCKLCNKAMDLECERSGKDALIHGCFYSSRCVEVVEDGLWNTQCEHKIIDEGDSILVNKCYEKVCKGDGEFVERKTEKAYLWEHQANGCFEYHCDNRTGFISWSKCNSTKEIQRVCLAGKFKCSEVGRKSPEKSSDDDSKGSDEKSTTVDENDDVVESIDNSYKIVFEIDSNSTDFSLEKFIKRVLEKSKVDPEGVVFGANINNNGEYMSVYITVASRQDADIIADTVNHDEEIEYVKSSHVEGRSLIAKASHIKELMLFIFTTLVIVISSTFWS